MRTTLRRGGSFWNWRRVKGCKCTWPCFLGNAVLGLYTLFAVWILALTIAAACGAPVELADFLPLWPWLLPILPLAMLAYLACHRRRARSRPSP